MGRMNPNHYLESGPIVRLFAGVVIVGIVALGIYAIASANGFAIALLATIALTTVTGLILERLDSSRSRSPGSEGTTDEHWGFRGRPGA